MNAATPSASLAKPKARVSLLEEAYSLFPDTLASKVDAANVSCGRLMSRMNRINVLCAGLSTVMRIIAGSQVAGDFYEPEDPDSEVPLSAGTVASLASLSAEVLDMVAGEIDGAANWYGSKVEA
jgi:hypothetical protein